MNEQTTNRERLVKCSPATRLPLHGWSVYLEGKLFRTDLSMADAIDKLNLAVVILSEGADHLTGFRPMQLEHPNWTAYTLEPLGANEEDYPDADTFAHWGETDWPQRQHPMFSR